MNHLLLLHGALGSSEQFDDLTVRLADRYIIDRLSFSGHGRTPSLPNAFTIQNCAHEVLEWLNTHQRQSIDIFGYSMGGYVALWLARYYPDRVGRIFTLGTKLRWSEEIAEKEISLLNADKIMQKVPHYADELAQRHGEREWRSVLQKTALLMHDLGKHHLAPEDFKQIKANVCLALGDTDNMVSHDETQYVETIIPNAVFLSLEDTLHPFEKVPLTQLSDSLRSFFG
jgi:pimeloyl-ACP methyl ester carboxylesterase